MRVALTGTPGTGKTTVADRIETDLSVIHLGELVDREDLYEGVDEARETSVVDVEGVRDRLADREDYLVESHLAHLLDVDRVIVLRAHPETIESRLADRGESESSIAENAESEALDLILAEAVDRHGRDAVAEIDTTDRDPGAVAADVEAVLAGEADPGVGTVSFVDYLDT